jgi:DNA polymerase-1
MRRVVCDIECTTSNKGNPFDRRNTLVVVGIRDIDSKEVFLFYYPTKEDIKQIQSILSSCLFIAHNAKFDLHWIKKIGVDFSTIKVWCTQLGEFVLSNQKLKFPSLEDASVRYNLGHKIDVIKNDFWDKGIDTNDIPQQILSEYLEQDLYLTEQLYLKQRGLFEKEHASKYNLFKLHCQDLIVLEEMEYNGILFDVENALKMAEGIQKEQDALYKEMVSILGNVPFNLNSGDHLSAIFYGGDIVVESHIPVGVFKTGKKIGETRYKIIEKKYTMPRLVEPLAKTEAKKPIGSPPVWFTNDDVLRSLKHTKESRKIMTLVSKYSELEKLRGTYLTGLPQLIKTMEWDNEVLHGQLNQCIAITGRLSSSKPNMQNFPPIAKTFCVSRYA